MRAAKPRLQPPKGIVLLVCQGHVHRLPVIRRVSRAQPKRSRDPCQVVVILGEASVLVCGSVRDELLPAALTSTVLILEVELAESATALEADSATEHHHDVRVAGLHLRVAPLAAPVLPERALAPVGGRPVRWAPGYRHLRLQLGLLLILIIGREIVSCRIYLESARAS